MTTKEKDLWPINRRKQVDDLENLISIIRGLNNGNMFIEKVQAAIEIADNLSRSDLMSKPPVTSFMNFLHDKCLGEDVE